MDLPLSYRMAVAAHHRVSGRLLQAIDFIDCSALPRNRARNHESRRIKQLALIWAGFPQSYPQTEWKVGKGPSNQQLGGIPSQRIELWSVTASRVMP
jgi:hypothetical protein